jgi:hypothetical protein
MIFLVFEPQTGTIKKGVSGCVTLLVYRRRALGVGFKVG